MSLRHCVRLPLGKVIVELERSTLGLGERGGFEASWADDEAEPSISAEDYRKLVKIYLAETYVAQNGRAPSKVTLNLASHQLLDDLIGWSKLNAAPSHD